MNGDITPPVQGIDPKAKEVRAMVRKALAEAKVPLGQAVLKTGATTEALNVGDWPDGTTVNGLEVLVPTAPKLLKPEAFAFLGFSRVRLLRFINHAAKPDILEQAANAIAEFFPDCEDPRLLEESPDTPEQMVIGVNADQLGR